MQQLAELKSDGCVTLNHSKTPGNLRQKAAGPIRGRRAQVRVTDSRLRILNDRVIRAHKVRGPRADYELS